MSRHLDAEQARSILESDVWAILESDDPGDAVGVAVDAVAALRNIIETHVWDETLFNGAAGALEAYDAMLAREREGLEEIAREERPMPT